MNQHYSFDTKEQKYDYIYINADNNVRGRWSSVDYGNDDNEGVILGNCLNMGAALKVADYFARKAPYGIKYSEDIHIILVPETTVQGRFFS